MVEVFGKEGALIDASASLKARYLAKYESFGNADDFYESVEAHEKHDALKFLTIVAKVNPKVKKVSELPAWDTIFNDKGQSLSLEASRPKGVAILGVGSDSEKRCFILVSGISAGIDRKISYQLAMNNMASSGQIMVDEALFDLIFKQWDEGMSFSSSVDSDTELQAKFDEIGAAAISKNASDIHFTWRKNQARINFRINGELQHHSDMSVKECRDLITCAYNTLVEAGSTKSGFNEGSLQDGIIERTINGVKVRFRYSGLPIALGYDVTMRVIVMGDEASIRPSKDIGYADEQYKQIKRAFNRSGGIVLFVGATGSGKSSSMASFLKEKAIDEPGKKIRSVEEPVETIIPGVAQTAVKRLSADNSDFQAVLRQLLRSDPDVIMVGEIRDRMTAEMAFQASLTGHLIISTLHVKNACMAFDRLVGMGCARSEVAMAGLINLIVYQTLLPGLCPHCKVLGSRYGGELKGIDERLTNIGLRYEDMYFESPNGCGHCHSTGVSGREVCAEVIPVTDTLTEYVKNADSIGFWKAWRATGKGDDDMTGKTAFEHALLKMRQGLISPFSVESAFQMIDEEVTA